MTPPDAGGFCFVTHSLKEVVGHLLHGGTSGHLSEKDKQRLIWSQVKTGNNLDEIWTIAFASLELLIKWLFLKTYKGFHGTKMNQLT
jgi:hypothetical protein